jgi:hypothetical protein
MGYEKLGVSDYSGISGCLLSFGRAEFSDDEGLLNEQF